MKPYGDKRRIDIVLLISTFAVFILILGAVTGLVLEGLGQLYEGHAYYQKNGQTQRDAATKIITKTCVRIDGTVIPECLVKEIGAYYAQQATNQDLKAQQDMAYWAMWLFILGVGQIVVSGVGIYFIWDSLLLNRAMAKAANDANSVTREMGEAQSRAYIAFQKATVTITGNHVSIVPAIANSGQSFALNVTGIFDLSITYRGPRTCESIPSFELQHFDNQECNFGVILPSEINATPTDIYWVEPRVRMKNYNSILDHRNLDKQVTVTSAGILRWEDVFRKKWKIEFTVSAQNFIPERNGSKPIMIGQANLSYNKFESDG